MTERPTAVRHWILAATTAAAFLMYLDRICMAAIMNSDSFKEDIPLSPVMDGWIKGAFFAAYALGQLPAGYLAVRFGARSLMSIYIVLWSIFTVLTGFATGRYRSSSPGLVAPLLTVTVIASFGDWRLADHPSVNPAELTLLEADRPAAAVEGEKKTYVFLWRIALTHRSLWMNSGSTPRIGSRMPPETPHSCSVPRVVRPRGR